MSSTTKQTIQDLERNKFVVDSETEATVRVSQAEVVSVERSDSFLDRDLLESMLYEMKLTNEYLKYIYGDSLRDDAAME